MLGLADMRDILPILIKHGIEDTVVWHFDKKRFFSVKSAYGTPILAEMLVPL
jgi:hypothetical protein